MRTRCRPRSFARDLRKETHERLGAALARLREARNVRSPAVDASTAAWATLRLGDTISENVAAETAKIVNVLAFAELDGTGVRT